MGVRIDAALHAFLAGKLPPAPVHVETPAAGVEFDDGAGFRSGIEDGGHIDGIRGPLQQQAAGEMADHRDIRVLDGLDDAFCHLRLGQIEDVVHAGDGVVELRENFVGEVQRAVFEDVHLAAGEDAKVFKLGVELANLRDLRQQPLFIESVRLERGLAVIRDAKILQT